MTKLKELQQQYIARLNRCAEVATHPTFENTLEKHKDIMGNLDGARPHQWYADGVWVMPEGVLIVDNSLA